MIVEFAGPSGAGKSRLSGACIEALTARGLAVVAVHESAMESRFALPEYLRNPARQGWRTDVWAVPHVFLFGIRWPRAAVGMFAELLRSTLFGKHRLAVMRAVWRKLALREYFASRRFERRVVIVDEGMVHAVHNAYLSPTWRAPQERVERFARTVPLPNVLVLCVASEHVILERLQKRGEYSPRVCAEGELEGMTRHAVTVFNDMRIALRSRLSQRGERCELVVVHDDSDMESAVRFIVNRAAEQCTCDGRS